MSELFRKFSHKISQIVGSPISFLLAIIVIILWALVGSIFAYSDTWQLVINTSTTIVTFLMVFLIQNTQNRDARAMHLKLDELIKAAKGARTAMVNLEELSDEELEVFSQEFRKIQERYERRLAAKQESGSIQTTVATTEVTSIKK